VNVFINLSIKSNHIDNLDVQQRSKVLDSIYILSIWF